MEELTRQLEAIIILMWIGAGCGIGAFLTMSVVVLTRPTKSRWQKPSWLEGMEEESKPKSTGGLRLFLVSVLIASGAGALLLTQSSDRIAPLFGLVLPLSLGLLVIALLMKLISLFRNKV